MNKLENNKNIINKGDNNKCILIKQEDNTMLEQVLKINM